MEYAPENYRPRPLAFSQQVTREVARASKTSKRPLLADRWSTETRTNYRPPSRGGVANAVSSPDGPEVAVTNVEPADQGALVEAAAPSTAVVPAPAAAAHDAAVAVASHADPAALTTGGKRAHVDTERAPFATFAPSSKNALVTGAVRQKPTVMLPRPRSGTRPMSGAIGASQRITEQLNREARMPGHVRGPMVEQPEAGRAAAAALQTARVPARYTTKSNAAARCNSGPTTRVGITAAEAATRRSTIARAKAGTQTADACMQTETDGSVAIVGDEARNLYSTAYALCAACSKMHRTAGTGSPKCTVCGRPLLRLFATENLHVSATSGRPTPGSGSGQVESDKGFSGAAKITALAPPSRRVAGATPASSRPASAASSADAPTGGRRRVSLSEFAAGVSEIPDRPRSRSRSQHSGGGSASSIRAAMTMID